MPLGKTYLTATNPTNGIYLFNTVFVVIKEVCMSLIGDKSQQHMELLKLSIKLSSTPLSKNYLQNIQMFLKVLIIWNRNNT